MGRYDFYNQNGDRLCERVGCRKHKRLWFAYQGWFCAEHLTALQQLRAHLLSVKWTRFRTQCTLFQEYSLRLEEYQFRKTVDGGHVYRIRFLHNTLVCMRQYYL